MDNFKKLVKVIEDFKSGVQADLETKEGPLLHRAQGWAAAIKEILSRADLIKKGTHDEVFGEEE